MANFLDLARMAQSSYDLTNGAPPGWSMTAFQNGSYGFRAVAYSNGTETVVAFRGTNLSRDAIGGSAGDLAADVMLGVGMNTSHFSQAEAFTKGLSARGPVTLSGHSLGGAIAQIVGNRQRLPFATFNAPGVAVLASRNMLSQANPATQALRVAGSVVSAAVRPMQAARDIRSTFYRVHGVNIRLTSDLVSQIGVHYGKLIAIPGTSAMPQHSIDTVVQVLEGDALGRGAIAAYYPA